MALSIGWDLDEAFGQVEDESGIMIEGNSVPEVEIQSQIESESETELSSPDIFGFQVMEEDTPQTDDTSSDFFTDTPLNG